MTLAVSLVTLALVAWQVWRLEGMQPLDGWEVTHSRPGTVIDNRATVRITHRLMGPATLYEVEFLAVVGGVPKYDETARFAKVTSESAPVEMDVKYTLGEHVALIASWTEFTPLRRRPVRRGRRTLLSPKGAAVHSRWRWNVLIRRNRGKWVSRDRRRLRAALPQTAMTDHD